MSNIRLFFKESLSLNLTAKLDKSQSHYVNKVMRVKVGEVFSLFNNSGEWEAKILTISKSIVEFNITKQLRQKETLNELWLANHNSFKVSFCLNCFVILNSTILFEIVKIFASHSPLLLNKEKTSPTLTLITLFT